MKRRRFIVGSLSSIGSYSVLRSNIANGSSLQLSSTNSRYKIDKSNIETLVLPINKFTVDTSNIDTNRSGNVEFEGYINGEYIGLIDSYNINLKNGTNHFDSISLDISQADNFTSSDLNFGDNNELSVQIVAVVRHPSIKTISDVLEFTIVSSNTDEIIADFESGNFDGFTTYNNVSIDSKAYSGNYSTRLERDGSYPTIISNSGLPNYPNIGDTWQHWFYGTSESVAFVFYWFTQSETVRRPDGYSLVVNNFGQTPKLVIQRVIDGNVENIQSSEVNNYTTGNWYQLVLNHTQDNTITATLYEENGTNLGSVSHSDDTYTDGGVGCFIFTSTGTQKNVGFTDNWRIIG